MSMMDFRSRDPKAPLARPKETAAGKKKVQARGGRGGGQKQGGKEDTEEHAKEVKAVMGGQDIVESAASGTEVEKRPAAFESDQMKVVRSWLDSRPLEPKTAATAMVPYPRNWNSKRGRYCKFKAPGAGVYGILRARPTF